jgi:hypothetical protein
VLNEFTRSWLQLSLDMMRLSFEAQSVIGLRLFRMATGGVPAGPEAMHVTFADIQRILVLSAPSGQPQEAAPKGVRHEAVMSSSPDQNEPLVTPRPDPANPLFNPPTFPGHVPEDAPPAQPNELPPDPDGSPSQPAADWDHPFGPHQRQR